MGSSCIHCYKEKSSEEIFPGHMNIPETIKVSSWPQPVSFIESEYESVPLLSLPSMSEASKSGSMNFRVSREVLKPIQHK
jgi:hypothetical protein